MRKKGSSFQQRVVLGVVIMLIFVYAFYHFVGLFDSEIKTYAAGVTTERTVLGAQGYVFRDEQVLTSSYSGTVEYLTDDGVKVSQGQAVASVYEGGTAEASRTLLRLDSQIELLENSLGEALQGVEMGELKQENGQTYNALVKILATGETADLATQKEAFLMELNQMEGLAKKEEAEGYATLEALRAERQAILSAGGGSQTYCAERSGYFYIETDGYEDYFTMEAASNLTEASFYELVSKRPKKQEGGKVYGKLCASNEWKLVLPMEKPASSYFEEGGVYIGEFVNNHRVTIPLTLERMIETSDGETILLIFGADRLPQDFSFDRTQSVRLEVDSVSGIYVPRNVVERVDGFRGVYVLRGSVVYFRRIEIVYEGNDYYLVKEGLESEDVSYLQVNDLIILNGKNMFDGRVLD